MYFTQINNTLVVRLEILIVQNRFHSKLNCSMWSDRAGSRDRVRVRERKRIKETHMWICTGKQNKKGKENEPH